MVVYKFLEKLDNFKYLGINQWYKTKYRIIIEKDEDGAFIAECPNLPGCISQGKSRDEAIIN